MVHRLQEHCEVQCTEQRLADVSVLLEFILILDALIDGDAGTDMPKRGDEEPCLQIRAQLWVCTVDGQQMKERDLGRARLVSTSKFVNG